MKPPKCRSCGAEEWRHVCGGLPDIKAKIAGMSSRPKLITSIPETAIKSAAKFDRAAYMRERHAKRKSAEQSNA